MIEMVIEICKVEPYPGQIEYYFTLVSPGQVNSSVITHGEVEHLLDYWKINSVVYMQNRRFLALPKFTQSISLKILAIHAKYTAPLSIGTRVIVYGRLLERLNDTFSEPINEEEVLAEAHRFYQDGK